MPDLCRQTLHTAQLYQVHTDRSCTRYRYTSCMQTDTAYSTVISGTYRQTQHAAQVYRCPLTDTEHDVRHRYTRCRQISGAHGVRYRYTRCFQTSAVHTVRGTGTPGIYRQISGAYGVRHRYTRCIQTDLWCIRCTAQVHQVNTDRSVVHTVYGTGTPGVYRSVEHTVRGTRLYQVFTGRRRLTDATDTTGTKCRCVNVVPRSVW